MYVRRGLGRLRGLGASALAQQLAAAVRRMENTNPAYNNPCGLIAGSGMVGKAGNGIAIFSDAATGESNCETNLQNYIDQGYSLSSLTQKWAPAEGTPGCGAMCAGNDPAHYARNLSTWTGIDPNTPLNAIAAGTGAGSAPTFDPSAFDFSSLASGFDLSSIDWSVVVPIAGLGLVLVLVLSRGR